MLKINNLELAPLIKSAYTPADLLAIENFLRDHRVLEFTPLPNGLFPAADLQADAQYTGYASIWLRDNIHIAHAHYVVGKSAVAVETVKTLLAYMKKQSPRFVNIINKAADHQHVMHRPHVRFDGLTLSDIDQVWAHAQNDALGYLLWLYFKLASDRHIVPSPTDLDFLALFPHYFNALPFWEDEDSGHWEETRKISASSIGVVTGALRQMRAYWSSHGLDGKCGTPEFSVDTAMLDTLITHGEHALKAILPKECAQIATTQSRHHDGALIFLIYPLDVVDDAVADEILSNVKTVLQGDYGIRRYIGDSFWAPGYKQKMSEALRTADFSTDLSARDAMLEVGGEAQWCIFDPIISTIYGRRYQATHNPADLEQQTVYLNRSLGQITGTEGPHPAYKCPELYYIENGHYVPSDATPLLWTQANLLIALATMEKSLALQR